MTRIRHDGSFVTCSSVKSLDSIQEDAAEQPDDENITNGLFQLPKMWKKSVVKTLKETVPLPPALPLRPNAEQHSFRASVRSSVKESFHNTASFVTAPLRSLPVPPSLLRRRDADRSDEEVKEQHPRHHSRLNAFRPFHRRRGAPIHSSRSEYFLSPMSMRELNATIAVPVYKQLSMDFFALIMDFCSNWVQTCIAVLFLFLPISLLHSWWYRLVQSWPIQLVYGYWLWLTHTLHTFRQQAHVGQSQRTSRSLAGAVVAIYTTSIQQNTPLSKPRRSKRKRRRSSVGGE